MSDVGLAPETFHAVIPSMPDRHSAYVLFDVPYEYDCDECCDVKWVKVVNRYEIHDFKTGEPRTVDGHYMRPCSQCLPERYRIMIEQDHIRPEHLEKGGCATCRRYVQPWTNKK